MISSSQLYALGLSRHQLMARVKAGWLHRLHRGVYAVGHRSITTEGAWMAAVLAAGRSPRLVGAGPSHPEGAFLSHQAAAELWRIRERRGDDVIDVTVPASGGRPRRRGMVIHRVATLQPEETTRHRGIPVTTPARTILDLATVLPRRAMERAIDQAERVRLCRQCDLARVALTHTGRAGAGALRRILGSHQARSTATRSELEERFLALCRQRRLPAPEVNARLLDYTVDFLWRNARLVVEVDGRASHGTRRAFQEDRDRDGRLAVSGYRVLRFTWWDVTARPAVVADRVLRVLAPSE